MSAQAARARRVASAMRRVDRRHARRERRLGAAGFTLARGWRAAGLTVQGWEFGRPVVDTVPL